MSVDLADLFLSPNLPFSTSVEALFENNGLDEDQLYERISELIISYPHLSPGVASYKSTLHLPRHSNFEELVELDLMKRGRKKSNLHFEQFATVLQVIHRMYEEGCAFQDLDHQLLKWLKVESFKVNIPYELAGSYYLLYKHFPHLMQVFKESLGISLMTSCHKQIGKLLTNTPGRNRAAVLQEHLLALLMEVKIKPMSFIQFLLREDFPQGILIPAAQKGLLGTDWRSDLDKILQTMMNRYIGESLL